MKSGAVNLARHFFHFQNTLKNPFKGTSYTVMQGSLYKSRKMKDRFKDIGEFKDFLKSKIFVSQNERSYVFDDDTYAILLGNFSLLILRNNIVWKNINTKYRYAIFQYESNFIFRTYDNEISRKENEFIISVTKNQTETYTVSFSSLKDKSNKLKLLSD